MTNWKSLIAAGALAVASAGVAFAQETAPVAPPTAAAPPQAVAPAAATEPAPAAAPAPAAPAVVAPPVVAPPVVIDARAGAPPAGKGLIVFYRPSRFAGGGLTFTVRENEVDLGRLPNGRYFVHAATPGIHAYEIGRNDTLRMEVEEGVTYYVQQSTQMGIVAGRAVLSPSDKATFDQHGNLKVSTPRP